ncbi:MAG: hypothetical protein ACKVP7_15595 [Hyphomicrobiaceae bacterium]
MTVVERGVRVSTHCLYPSNSSVMVTVVQWGDFYRVDDAGAALDEVSQSIQTEQNLKSMMRGIVKRRGCDLTDRGEIISPMVSYSDLRAAIVLVANASKTAAEYLLANARPPRRDFKKAIEDILNLKFKDKWSRNGKIAGASTKEHGFDYVVNISGGRQLALDFVMPDANSVNSAVVAHLDVRMKNAPNLEQRIVYDDMQPWRSSDIELLKAGARPVPFSSLRQSLEKLAA